MFPYQEHVYGVLQNYFLIDLKEINILKIYIILDANVKVCQDIIIFKISKVLKKGRSYIKI